MKKAFLAIVTAFALTMAAPLFGRRLRSVAAMRGTPGARTSGSRAHGRRTVTGILSAVAMAMAAALLPMGAFPVAAARADTSGGTFVYVNDDSSTNAVSGFSAAPDGSLTPIPGSPFPTGGSGGFVGFFVADHGTMVRSANRIYVVNQVSRSLTGFSINPVSGVLSMLPGFPTAIGFGSGLYTLTASPGGAELFIAEQPGGQVQGRVINADGSLGAAVTTAPVASANEMSASSDGRWLAVARTLQSTITLFPISAGGVLGTGVDTAMTEVTGVRFTPDSRGLIAGGVVGLTSYAVQPAGTLTPVTSMTVTDPQAVAVSGNGRWAFAGSPNSSTVFSSALGSNLVLGTPSSAPACGRVSSVSSNSDGSRLYASALNGRVCGWTVGTTGALTPVPGAYVSLPPGTSPHTVMVVDAGVPSSTGQNENGQNGPNQNGDSQGNN